MKPKLFIASSVEGLDAAYEIQVNLQHDAHVTVWPQGVFGLSDTPLDSLVDVLDSCDFGVFVFNPDDMVYMRGDEHNVVRDNVLFELGMFIGKLGKRRCFVVAPNEPDIYLPSDLWGFSIAKYDANRDDLPGALGPACHGIRSAIKKHGLYNRVHGSGSNIAVNSYDNYDQEDKLALLESWLKVDKTDLALKFKDIDNALEIESGASKELLPIIISRRPNFSIGTIGANIIRIIYTPSPRRRAAVGIRL